MCLCVCVIGTGSVQAASYTQIVGKPSNLGDIKQSEFWPYSTMQAYVPQAMTMLLNMCAMDFRGIIDIGLKPTALKLTGEWTGWPIILENACI